MTPRFKFDISVARETSVDRVATRLRLKIQNFHISLTK